MAETSIYVPVLKSKMGEYLALRHLLYSSLRFITPLIDISQPAKPRKGSPKATSLATQMKHHAKYIGECWRFADLPVFVDTQSMPDSGQALRLLFEMLKNHNIVPTHGPGRGESCGDAAVEIVKQNPTRGACYRIPKDMLYDSGLDKRRVVLA